jgi:hypothetical protein
MKQFKNAPAVLVVTCTMFLSSCGNNQQKNEAASTDSATSTTSTTTTTTTAPSKTDIDTTPHTTLLVRHKVANYAKWKTSYDGHDSFRIAHGIHNYVIARGVEDSNMLLVATKADDVAKAKAFIKDPSLKAAMQKGGVIGSPLILLNTTVYTDNSANMSDLRAMTNFTVKDWDVWKKAFESNRQFRAEQGLTDRAYGHDVDDNHKVTLVLAINDTAKANAFWNSAAIKQKRAESGVVGEVKRFVYHVVQKY